jgi:hypothetical protein
MIEKKKFSANPGRPYISKVGGEILSPSLKVVKSCIKIGHTFQNQATRYYLITSCDPIICGEFLEKLENRRLELGCEIFLTEESKPNPMGGYDPTGLYVMKFASKCVPLINSVDGTELELTKELPVGTDISILFEIVCYLDKSCGKYKMSFPIKKIIILEGK